MYGYVPTDYSKKKCIKQSMASVLVKYKLNNTEGKTRFLEKFLVYIGTWVVFSITAINFYNELVMQIVLKALSIIY